ncbi:DUF4860 domain-containing protein [Pseudobutyrivibrio ruminis]|uniref:DUF4860 domain-containing protein n=1 Tax=Pseudobutyrivibrio ruminis TaxID=46206 RepID=UPI0004050418|nr:DUF4860 domain-containing protein [Pseudobutyrivibrio ruminis]
MAVNSYKSVVFANESNANARIATAYIREQVRQHDEAGAITLGKFDGNDCIKMSEGEGYSLYIYEYDGFLMELEAKDNSGATADFGNKILEINDMSLDEKDGMLNVTIQEKSGEELNMKIGVKSTEVESDEE